jgi:peptidoglycan/xylan/chitin deacetylase (PgdA/CDA1 family)
MTLVKTLGRHALRIAAIRRAALTAGALRGNTLVLVFHKISGGERRPQQALIPSVPEHLLRQQIEALLDVGEIVGLEDLIRPHSDSYRPRFALTFDDDWITHYQRALPILQDLGVTATFFLSGRSLHRLGPLWFERLDGMIAERGIQTVARWLGIDTDDPERVATVCENEPSLQERIEELPEQEVHRLGSAEISALANAGMTIGFHTLQHPLLSRLSDSALDEALVRGRNELEVAAGGPIRLFAYPHGKPDARVATRLPGAGFVAACTGRPVPVRPGDDPYLLGRWEPGPIGLDRFVASVAIRLNGWSRGA